MSSVKILSDFVKLPIQIDIEQFIILCKQNSSFGIMKSYVFLLFFFLFAKSICSQEVIYSWVHSFGSTGIDAGNVILTDSKNSVITCGYFRDQIDFDPGSEELFLKSNGSADAFVTKLNQNSEVEWALHFGGKQIDQATAMAIDHENNIIVAGTFREGMDLTNLSPGLILTSLAFNDIFILKFNHRGILLWGTSLHGSLDDVPKSMHCDSKGNIYVTGYFQGSLSHQNKDSTIIELNSRGGDDVFILRMSPEGEMNWIKSMGGRLDDQGKGIALDKNDDLVVFGNFNDTIDIDPGPSRLLLNEKGLLDAFMIKLNDQGEMIWASHFHGVDEFLASSLVINSKNEIITTGYFRMEADFDPGINVYKLSTPLSGGDSYILNLKSDGSFNWAKQLGGDHHETGLGIALDKEGNIYSTGCYQNKADFDPGSGEFFLYSFNENNNDIYISKLNSKGDFAWAYGMSGNSSDIGFSIHVDQNHNVYTTGIFGKTLTVRPGLDSIAISSKGFEDIFISKLNQSISGNINLTYDTELQVSPNPTEGYIQISLPGDIKIFDLELFSSNGDMVRTSDRLFDRLDDKLNIHLPNLSSGIYFLKINSSKGIKYSKIVVSAIH
ncbi:MAG: SBBP repeat-containing protein [Saprospiraceae bacterium]|nr:SBBP repeat-containing protein [Saprospiraceae bacterium]